MQLSINCVNAEKIMRCKKDNLEVMHYVTLVNPQYAGYDSSIMFDMQVSLPDDYKICSKIDGNSEYLVITLSKIGNIELDTKDFRDITLY